MHTSARRLGSVALAACALAACGSSGSQPAASGSTTPPTSTSAQAAATTVTGSWSSAAATEPSTTAAASSTTTGAAPATSEDAGTPVTGTELPKKMAEAAAAVKSYHMVMSSVVNGQTVASEGDVDTARKALALTATMGSMKVSQRYVDGVMYVQAPGLTPAGKWRKIQGAELQEMGGGRIAESFSLAKQTSILPSAVRRIEDLGTEQVDGEQLHKYRMTIDSAKLIELMASTNPTGAKPSLPPTVEQTVWTDAGHHLRKSVSTLPGGTTTTEVSKIDEPVSVVAPSPAELLTR